MGLHADGPEVTSGKRGTRPGPLGAGRPELDWRVEGGTMLPSLFLWGDLAEGSSPTPKDEPPPTPPKRKEQVKTWIDFKVVWADSGEPVPRVRLTVTTPDGNQAFHTTGGDGLVHIKGIDPGTCDVTCRRQEPRLGNTLDFVRMGEGSGTAEAPARTGIQAIADVEEHKVASGESIKSLAEGAGLTWQQLAKFNWNTDVPEKINEHLRTDVGCTKRTADGNNYVFDDSDDPGIVFIPRLWERKGLATGETHVIAVQEVALRPARLILRLLDIYHEPMASYDYVLKVGDESFEGTTDGDGRLEHEVPRDAETAKLSCANWSIDLEIETLPPPDDVKGAQARLNNLGFYVRDEIDETDDDHYKRGVRAFQAHHDLEVTGGMCEQSWKKLEEIHGS